MRGLFHTIDVRKSTGISSVSGGGTYCYGTYVTISASSSAGYDFTNWNNDSSMSSSSYGFYVNSGGTYTAYAKAGTIAGITSLRTVIMKLTITTGRSARD